MKTWRMVRLPAELAYKLDLIAQEMERAHVEGRSLLPSEYCERVPLHYVVSKAVDELVGHRERSKRPRSKKGGVA